jgi:hypothetical protein
MIFEHLIARITLSTVVYGRAGCITFYYLQFGHALGIRFATTNTSRVYSLPPPVVWTCRVYSFPPPSQQNGHAGCIPIHRQQYGCALCRVYPFPLPAGMMVQGISPSTRARSMNMPGVSLSTTNSIDVESVSVSTASRMYMQGVSLTTARSIDMQGVSPSTASSMKVQGVRPFTTSSVNLQGVPKSFACSRRHMPLFPCPAMVLQKCYAQSGLEVGVMPCYRF